LRRLSTRKYRPERLRSMPRDLWGARFDLGGEVTAVSLVVEDDPITRIYAMRNRHKLGRLERVTELRR